MSGYGIGGGVEDQVQVNYYQQTPCHLVKISIDGQTTTLGQAIQEAGEATSAVANVISYGADPMGVEDSAPAFARALATGLAVYAPAGTYHLLSGLVVNETTLYGDGRELTTFTIAGDFSPSATYVLSLTGREFKSPIVRDLAITFQQPSTQGSRSNFKTLTAGGTSGPGGTGVEYPPAILLTTANRFRILNVSVSGAWDGIINAVSNTIGGFIIDNVEMGALNRGLSIDNCFDFGHIKSYHFWPFGLNVGNIENVYEDGNTYAARFGDNGPVEGINIVDFCVFAAGVYFTGASWANFSNLLLDSPQTVFYMVASGGGWVQISNCYLTGGQINQTSGIIIINNILGFNAIGDTRPLLTTSGGSFTINCGRMSSVTPGVSLLLQSGGANLVVNEVLFNGQGGVAWTVPFVNVTGSGAVTFTGNVFGTSPGDVGGLAITTDQANNIVMDNNFNNWNWTPPGDIGFYGINAGSNAALPALSFSGLSVSGLGGFTFRSPGITTGTFAMITTGNGTDQNIWDQFATGTQYVFRAVNDTYTAANAWCVVNRTGYVPTNVVMEAQTVAPSFRTNGTAGPTWTAGTGAPSSTQPNGSMYSRSDGGTGTRLYVSAGGGTWNAVAGV